MSGKWLERLKEKRREREFERAHARAIEETYERVTPMDAPTDPKILRHLSDEALHGWLGSVRAPEARIGLERELRRREAWAAPAGRAVRISACALVVSVIALVVSAVAVWLKV